ncbi:putative monovalent cation/H+ antiporter subunit F [Anaplasma phagocytophilum]|uniref:Monovalent cation/H+ antiporter subunit F n=1 Tax=Anaplasma phagocytophilum TaxID=948 RepID=A0AA45US40_ANAPH|nr:monovalent cation/H+ antiporter complex subunit F [Anaplasma phagocytophilum]SBO13898.1 putative monovalent cation/H+ antiporter subunit F [Anaplasma phagocytophilum]
MLKFSIFVLLACEAVMLFRIVSARSVYDRILAVNVFSTCVVMLMMLLGAMGGAVELFIDVSLMYACVGLVAAVGFARFFLYNGWR